jgi:hypothetical protein
VSEWMGYALLFESMLDSVLYARDRCLHLCPPSAARYTVQSMPRLQHEASVSKRCALRDARSQSGSRRASSVEGVACLMMHLQVPKN